MTQHETLGGFQQLVMLAILRLGDEAYGARMQRELDETAGRSVSISTVYVTMERLERKGLVESWLADPTPVRGGKSKRYYRLTKSGLRALRESREELDRMWQGVESHPELKSS
jgi:PadR family transcriptional regulator PadR